VRCRKQNGRPGTGNQSSLAYRTRSRRVRRSLLTRFPPGVTRRACRSDQSCRGRCVRGRLKRGVVHHHVRHIFGRITQARQRPISHPLRTPVGDQQLAAGLVFHLANCSSACATSLWRRREFWRARAAAVNDRGVIELVGNDEVPLPSSRHRPASGES